MSGTCNLSLAHEIIMTAVGIIFIKSIARNELKRGLDQNLLITTQKQN